MKPPKIGSAKQPFPTTRPEIAVTPSRARPFALDCCRLPGWGVALGVGAANWMSWYDPPDWQLTSVSYQRAARGAEVHGLDCVEIEMLDWEPPRARWKTGYTHFARVTEGKFEWLAVSHVREGKRILYTFLDEGFDRDWGASDRHVEDTGRLAVGDDGACTLTPASRETYHDCIGAGMYRVRVADRTFTCLRVIELNTSGGAKAPLERQILSESFFARSGELVLFRRYNGRRWKVRKGPYAGPPWDERLPGNGRLVINGAVFVHWYDCLTGVACGIGAARHTARGR